jgi:predicted nucleic acid-binding protein
MPLRGKLSRDPTDNVCVASAVAAHAAFVVTQDRDLLALQKPFGVQVVTQVQLIQALQL